MWIDCIRRPDRAAVVALLRLRDGAAQRLSVRLAAVIALAALGPSGEAFAACDPASGNNIIATCTGTTTNQGGGAPGTSAALIGYGTGADTNLNVTVVSGATVTGTNDGIRFDTGTVINNGAITGGNFGIVGVSATVVNYGTITGSIQGVGAGGPLNLTNFGTISGNTGARSTSGTINNYGTITGVTTGVFSNASTTVFNSGAITGGTTGVFYNSQSTLTTLTNSGTIAGGTNGIFVNVATAGLAVTNSGTIAGGTAALSFSNNPDTLTLLPGSTLIGPIILGGGGDTINFRGGNHNLTVDTLAGATVTSTTPFAVSGTQIAIVDPTPFAAAGSVLADFSRGTSSAVPEFDGQTAVIGAIGPTAFAAPEPASVVAAAFGGMPGLAAYASDRAAFKAPTVIHADGTAVWARGFGGYRVQQADGVLPRNANYYLGGAFGIDRQVRPDLRLGVFAGAGTARSTIDNNYGGLDSDLAFGGVYGRYSFGASYLKVAIQGGVSRNDSKRNINNNLVPGGIETATASYNGWYVSPEVTLGHNVALGHFLGAQHTLTPSVRVRYLYASLDGYTETGSTANLTVGTRTVENLEERAELKLTRIVTVSPNSALLIHLAGGALGVQRVGGDTINASLLGQSIPFATPGKSGIWGGFGGLGSEFRNANVAVFASAEYLAMSDHSSVVSGKAGARVSF